MNKLKKINFNKFLILYILIQPILDVLTSVFVRNISASLTIGVFVRTIFMAIIVIYSLIVLNKKDKIKLFAYYMLLAIYSIIYMVICYFNNGTNMIIIQIKGLVKTLYLPVVLASMFALYKFEKIKINTKYLIYVLCSYCAVIVFAKYFDIGYSSYMYGTKLGTVGWFYAANEIGAILAILAPYLLIEKTNAKINIFYLITYVLLICSILELGTKVPFLAFIILIIINLIINVYRIFALKGKEYLKKLIISFASILFVILIIGVTPIGKNLNINFIKFEKDNISQEVPEEPENNNIGTFEGDVTSGRTGFFKDNFQAYINSGCSRLLFGTSYLKVDGGEVVEKKLVEMDFFDIFINHGIIGFILILGPMLIMTVSIIFKNLKQFTKLLKEPERLYYLYAYFIGLAVSFLSGHVLTSPAVSIYIIIALILNMQIINDEKIEG